MSDCCHKPEQPPKPEKPACHQPVESASACCPPPKRIDWLFWGSLGFVGVCYAAYWASAWVAWPNALYHLFHVVKDLVHTVWWGVLLGILFVGLLDKVPRDFVMSALGTGSGFVPVLRSTCAGVLLDLCSHGILMVGMKLYERGASLGQVIAFLVASPWNSFSLTLILIALIGLKWTLVFIVLSMLVGIVAGVLCDALVATGRLPANPNRQHVRDGFRFWAEAKQGLQATRFDAAFWTSSIRTGFVDGKMILRWIFFGVMLASLIQAFIPTDIFQQWVGPSLLGLFVTLVATTIIEVCSEGSSPIAADILNRGGAPGNAFVFLMAGVATDYTEIMSLKETTRSWKMALILPALTVPQVLLIGWLLNSLS
ncbi:MAG: ATPase [Gammaproteobacteria bacterium]|nr:MAG: ATPase [Gammaproteobacteria bacterium]